MASGQEQIMVQHVRNVRKEEQSFYDRENSQRCEVCGKRFIKRAGKICSMDCAIKQANEKQ
jgi:hypothetical protein